MNNQNADDVQQEAYTTNDQDIAGLLNDWLQSVDVDVETTTTSPSRCMNLSIA